MSQQEYEANLHPGLLERWRKAKAIWDEKYPDGPAVILTCTYRSPQEQNTLYAQGRTIGGPKVTNARGGQSLHNYLPALAFDVAFLKINGQLDWSEGHFKEFAQIVKGFGGVDWGGDWSSFKDMPHFQPENFSWQKARDGIEPVFGGGAVKVPKPPLYGGNGDHPLLVKGSKGAAVRRVQEALKKKGYYDGNIDEDYGQVTFDAVWSFQEDYDIGVDGQVGPQTWAAIEAA